MDDIVGIIQSNAYEFSVGYSFGKLASKLNTSN